MNNEGLLGRTTGGMVNESITSFGPISAKQIQDYVTVGVDPSTYGASSEINEFRDSLKLDLSLRGMIVHRNAKGPGDEFEVFNDGIGQLETTSAKRLTFSGRSSRDQLVHHLISKYKHFSFYSLDVMRYLDELNNETTIFYTLRFHAW